MEGVFEVGVDLWIPLGAGGHVVRLNGKPFEALSALIQRRPRLDLYHAAPEVAAGGACYVIELAPVPDRAGPAGASLARARWEAGGLAGTPSSLLGLGAVY
jgi:hypothetical protein